MSQFYHAIASITSPKAAMPGDSSLVVLARFQLSQLQRHPPHGLRVRADLDFLGSGA
jgi:hypothetical protein